MSSQNRNLYREAMKEAAKIPIPEPTPEELEEIRAPMREAIRQAVLEEREAWERRIREANDAAETLNEKGEALMALAARRPPVVWTPDEVHDVVPKGYQ